MKIKMIDLFKLMLERKAPKKIRVLGIDMTFIETAEWGDYKDDDCCRLSEFRLTDCLNEDVEIIEEPKKIEKLDVALLGQCDNWLRCPTNKVIKQDVELNPYIIDNIRENTLYFQRKINELIDEINNLKENKYE